METPNLDELEVFWRYVEADMQTGCWVWTGGHNKDGYGKCRLRGEGQAHRAAWSLFRGEIPDGSSVLHRCDNPPCVNPAHLWLGTQKDNMQDCAKKGRISMHIVKRGSEHRTALLDDLDVMLIRKAYGTGLFTQATLALMFGVAQSNISQIVRGTTWPNLPILTEEAREALRGGNRG